MEPYVSPTSFLGSSYVIPNVSGPTISRMTRAPAPGAFGTMPDAGGWLAHVHAVARRVAVTALVLAVSLVSAEYAARVVFRRAHSSGRAGDFVATHGGGP